MSLNNNQSIEQNQKEYLMIKLHHPYQGSWLYEQIHCRFSKNPTAISFLLISGVKHTQPKLL